MCRINGIYRPLRPFSEDEVASVPHVQGVYVIYDFAGPIYVGRSSWSVRSRLLDHLRRTSKGSRVIAWAIGRGARSSLLFEYKQFASFEKTEALLIDRLGTHHFANLRRETDPACRGDLTRLS
jgi:hypothetical protein